MFSPTTERKASLPTTEREWKVRFGNCHELLDSAFNAQVVFARRAVLTVFCMNWAFTDDGVTPEEQAEIDLTEIALRDMPSSEARQRLERLARFYADPGEQLSDDDRALIEKTDRRLQALRLRPIAW